MNVHAIATRSHAAGDETRRMSFNPKSLDEGAGTVEATFATETPVRRWYGSEILHCRDSAIDLSRLIAAPVLDSHDRFSINSVIGRVESARVAGNKLVGVFKFSDGPEGQAAKRKVAEGMIRSVSVGYELIEVDDKRNAEGDTERHVTKWRPYEISLVSVPADPKATIRSKEQNRMDPEEENITVENPPIETRSRSQTTDRRFERQIEQLRTQAIGAGLAEADLDEMFDDVRTIDEARGAVFDALADRSRGDRTTPRRETRDRAATDDETRQAIVEELAVRLGATPTAGERPYAAMRTVEIGRHYMESHGVSTRSYDDHRIADMMVSPANYATRGMHSVSDFPLIFGDASNRALLDRYRDQVTPLKSLSLKRNARDFRPQSFIRPGEAPRLEKLAENGEVRRGTLSEEKNGLVIETYARIFGLSRKAIINDDLGAFADFVRAFAESSAQTEGDLFYAILSANSFAGATLPDGNSLFHTDRGNLAASGAAPDVTTLGAAREAMRLQKNVNGTGRAGVTPAVILVGPKLETAAEKLVAEITAATADNVNPFAGKLRIEVENRYEGVGWWLFADPAMRPALMHGYLDGSEGPQVDTREGWDVLGTEFRCLLDFGCGVMDPRAAYFNPGV